MERKTPTLAAPLALPCGATLRNRLMKAAMTEGLARGDGCANERHVTLYRSWARGGAALLITGNVMIDARYLERPGNVVVDGNGGLDGLREWARAVTECGAHLWMQLSHPGRQTSRASSNEPVAPSSVPLKLLGYFARPRAMTADEIRAAVAGYARVAQIARDAGFTGVQIHAAHGYLISQFLSPVTNRRGDEWGGPLTHRARFLLEAVRAVRSAVGADFPVAVKLNSADFQKGGFTLEECCEVARWLESERIDLLELSGGTYEQPRLVGFTGREETRDEPPAASTRRREAYFLEYARAVRAATQLPLAVTGGFRMRASMERAVAAGDLDVVGLARPLCVQPDLPLGLLDHVGEAPAYERELRLGRSRWLGPASPSDALRALNTQASVAWFYRQIIHLSRGEPPELELTARRALTQHFRDELRLALARRRWLRSRETTCADRM